jgi:hypothetical protein
MAKKTAKKKANYRKDCLDLWSLIVRTKQRKCQFIGCGSDSHLSAHHIRSASHHSTQLDEENGLCVCWGHHHLQKVKSEWFQDKVIEVIGQAEYDRLKAKSAYPLKYTTKDYREMVPHLKARLRALMEDYGEI